MQSLSFATSHSLLLPKKGFRFNVLLLLLGFAYCFLTSFLACAEDVQSIHDPKAFVEALGKGTIAILTDTGLDDATRTKKLEDIFDEYVDTRWMSHFILGQYRRQASDAQLAQFEDLYHQFLLQKYMPKFKNYAGEVLKVTNVEPLSDKDTLVQTVIARAGKPDLHVDYRLRKGSSGDKDPFQVIDIVAEGVSLINTHRSEFGAIISQKGINGFFDVIKSRLKNASAS